MEIITLEYFHWPTCHVTLFLLVNHVMLLCLLNYHYLLGPTKKVVNVQLNNNLGTKMGNIIETILAG